MRIWENLALSRRSPIGLLLLTAIVAAGCGGGGGGSPSVSNNAPAASPVTAASPAPSPLTGFERDLQYIRNGGFTYVWIFSRKDGKRLDKDDSAYLRTNAPQVVDWVTTDEGRKVIAGTNFNLEEGNLEALKKRFVAENYTGK
jgi:hypothetical protein